MRVAGFAFEEHAGQGNGTRAQTQRAHSGLMHPRACYLAAVRIGSPLFCLFLSLACAPRSQHHAGPPGHTHRFDDAQHWAAKFEDPKRDQWQKPQEVLDALQLPDQGSIADLGAATGYFAVRIARARPQATVFAVDIEPSMIQYLTDRRAKEHLPNLIPVLATAEDPRLPRTVDLLLIVDTYHHIADRISYFRRVKSTLTAGARIAVIDFTPESDIGPKPELRLTSDQVRTELEEAGFRQTAELRFLPKQYFLIFERAL
jgi:SAM-dependent methyltransferase